ncbi:MAG: peptide chain release factor 1 [Cyanobacteria bacterium J06639_16]
MQNPLQRLKYLPWLLLLQVAALTTAIAGATDILLTVGLLQLEQIGVISTGVFQSPLIGLILSLLMFGVAMGVGALGVLLMQRFFTQIYINTGVLWALVPCLGLTLFLFAQMRLPQLLVGISYPQLLGIVLGVFLCGRRYWRAF